MIEWKDGAVCFADNNQFIAGNKNHKYDLMSYYSACYIASTSEILQSEDFQLNEIRIGDYIEKSELDTEQKYNDVAEVFGLFGFLFGENAIYGYSNLSDDRQVGCCEDGLWHIYDSNYCERKLTYNQIMAIGKLKRMMDEKSAVKSAPKTAPEVSADNLKVTANKYEREISDRQGNIATVDVYDVLKAFNVTCPATQHAIKKLLCSGIRGHKDLTTDLIEAKESIVRAIELNG